MANAKREQTSKESPNPDGSSVGKQGLNVNEEMNRQAAMSDHVPDQQDVSKTDRQTGANDYVHLNRSEKGNRREGGA